MTTAPSYPVSGRVIPVLSAANFVIGMGAFMVIGLLIPLADSFAITPAQAGGLMVYYALGYAVLSPLLVALTGAIGRRRILAARLAIFALACLVAAISPSPVWLYCARIVAAAGAGLVTPVAASVAAGLSAPGQQARALASVFFGLTLAQVLGVPLGGFIAYSFCWRSAFAMVFLLCLPVIALIWLWVPAGLRFKPVSLGDLGRTLASPGDMAALAFTPLFIGATYAVYTYISPMLAQTMGFGRNGIALMLLLFGLGAVIGNILGGRLADRIGSYRTLILLALAQMLLLPCFSLLPFALPLLLALFFVWSACGWSFNAPQQLRLIARDPSNAPVILALNAAGIYIGSAIGSWLGAAMLSLVGMQALGFLGGAVAALALITLMTTEKRLSPLA